MISLQSCCKGRRERLEGRAQVLDQARHVGLLAGCVPELLVLLVQPSQFHCLPVLRLAQLLHHLEDLLGGRHCGHFSS
eukprot:10884420-Heterocapsa_arctica.AAC.1